MLAFLEKQYLEEISASSVENRSSPMKGAVEKAINRLGYHLAKVETIRELEKNNAPAGQRFWAFQTYCAALNDPTDFDRTFNLLEDHYSKLTFDWFIKARAAFAILGNRAFDLFPPPVDKEWFQRGLAEITEGTRRGKVFIAGFKLKSDPGILFFSFIAEQYKLPGLVEPEPGDYVFDLGGCFGETAFWFSRLVGETGRVFCFEPVPENYQILEENLRTNKVKNIISVNMAVGDLVGEIRMLGSGGGATSSWEGNPVPCITIDEYISRFRLEKVDMIKMDIEGSELKALQGAVETLKRFKPKLAVCVYHNGDDISKIPLFIEKLGLNYRLFLKHFSLDLRETILFAKSQ